MRERRSGPDSRRRVNLPARRFNQYNVECVAAALPFLAIRFRPMGGAKIGQGPFLVVGRGKRRTGEAISRGRSQRDSVASVSELPADSFGEWGGACARASRFGFIPATMRVTNTRSRRWRRRRKMFCSCPNQRAERRSAARNWCAVLRKRASSRITIATWGALEPGALRLIRAVPESAQALVPAVESAFARVQRRVHGLERSLRTRMSELEAADQHISKLEEKLLKLKEARQQLKQLKAEKQALRKSPERKVGQVLSGALSVAAEIGARDPETFSERNEGRRAVRKRRANIRTGSRRIAPTPRGFGPGCARKGALLITSRVSALSRRFLIRLCPGSRSACNPPSTRFTTSGS